MRITESRLRLIIREEARRVLRENFNFDDLYSYSNAELLSMRKKFNAGRQPEGANLDYGEKVLVIEMINGRLESIDAVIEHYKKAGEGAWRLVSNDFLDMGSGGMADFSESEWVKLDLDADDCLVIASELDNHFDAKRRTAL